VGWPLWAMFVFEAHGTQSITAFGGILDPREETLLLPGSGKAIGRLGHEFLRLVQQPCVLGQTDHIVNAVLLAPAQHFPTAETRVPRKMSFTAGHLLAQPEGPQLEDRLSVPGGINIAGPQITYQ
jgi:hypothetical protein